MLAPPHSMKSIRTGTSPNMCLVGSDSRLLTSTDIVVTRLPRMSHD